MWWTQTEQSPRFDLHQSPEITFLGNVGFRTARVIYDHSWRPQISLESTSRTYVTGSRSFLLSQTLLKAFIRPQTKQIIPAALLNSPRLEITEWWSCPLNSLCPGEWDSYSSKTQKFLSRASALVTHPSHFPPSQSGGSVPSNRAGPLQGFSHVWAKNVECVSLSSTQRMRYPEKSTWNDRKRDKLPYLEKTGLVAVCVSGYGMDVFKTMKWFLNLV